MPRREAARRAAGASASLGAIALAALIPKCPLCVAAALSALGLGAAVSASLAPVVRPIGRALAVVALVLAARAECRRRRRRGCERACGPAAAGLDPRG